MPKQMHSPDCLCISSLFRKSDRSRFEINIARELFSRTLPSKAFDLQRASYSREIKNAEERQLLVDK